MSLIITHLFNLFSYLAFYAFFYLSGRSFLVVLSSFTRINLNKKILFTRISITYPILGAFFVGNLLIFLNFFFPLKSFFIGIILFSFLLINFKNLNKQNLSFSIENTIIFILIPAILIFSQYNTGWHYDAGFYHLNHQNWLRESNLIIGMINIHWAFGMSSIYEYLSSIFWFDNSFKYLHYLNLIFIHFFYSMLIDNINNSKEAIIKNSSIFLLIYSLLDNFGINGGRNGFLYIQGVTKQDTAVAILFLTIARAIFIFLKKKSINDIDFSIVLILSLFMIQIKLSSVTIVVLLLYFIFRMMNLMRVKFNHFLIISLPSILLSIVWILKQYITTGCFIYPVSISCINNFSWYQSGSTEEYESITRGSSYSIPYFEFNLIDWGRYFYSFEINRTVITNFLISLIFLTIFYLLTTKRKALNFKNSLEYSIFIILNIIYLIYYGPTPRYTMGTFLLIVVFFGFITNEFKFSIKKVFLYTLIILSVGSIVRFSSYKSFINFDHSNLFDPRPIAKYVIQKNGYVKPDIGDQCWINLECTMSTHELIIQDQGFFSIAIRK